MGRGERKEGADGENGEAQGLHTRWHRGTGIVSQSHSEKQEGSGPTSPDVQVEVPLGLQTLHCRHNPSSSLPPTPMGAAAPWAGHVGQ